MCINSHSVPFPWVRTHCASAERRHSGNTNERMAMMAENDHAPVRRPEHGELLQRAQNLPSTSDMAAHERFRRDPAGGNGAMHCVMHAFHEPILSRETKSDSFTKILIVLVFSRQATTCDGSVHTRVHACNRHRNAHGWLKRKPFRANTVFITRQNNDEGLSHVVPVSWREQLHVRTVSPAWPGPHLQFRTYRRLPHAC